MNENQFKFNAPYWPYFYYPVSLATTVNENGHPIIGGWYGGFNFEGISTLVVPEESFAEPGKYFLELLKNSDSRFSKSLFDLCMSVVRLADDLQKIYFNDLQKGNTSDISGFYPSYTTIFPRALGFGFSLDYSFDGYIRENEIDISLIKPADLSFQAREKYELKSIFEISDYDVKMEMLSNHTNKYGWIFNNYHGQHPISRQYFLDREEEVRNIPKEENNIDIKQPKNINDWISLLIFIRDERKRANMIANGLLDRYLKEQCTKYGIKYKDAVMCTTDEFEILKLKSSAIPVRKKRFLRFDLQGCVDISEEEWDQIVGKEDQKEITEFKGRIASRGKIRAHVKIIMTSKDFPKMADGDIIVASMTRPEFAPILGKCSAIITDEGGVTCHAAIISRELNKPCIIGTKIATKVLKDGDMVEVDADKGVVTILNK